MIPSRVHIICVVSYVLQLPVEFTSVCELVHPRLCVRVRVMLFVIYLFVHIVRVSAIIFLSRASLVRCQFLYFSYYIFTMERVIFSSASLTSVAFKTPVSFGHGRDYNV